MEDNLKSENGIITIVHLDDGMDKLCIVYPSNIYIVEYHKGISEYDSGSWDINGKVHLHPNSTGYGSINWHTTIIRITSQMTNINVNCMILDEDASDFNPFT